MRHLSKEHRRKIALSRMGKKNPMYGKRCNVGSTNGQWKGDEVGYRGIHDYIKYYIPKPKICSTPNCGNTNYIELHNKSGLYLRNFYDWEWICRSCHTKKDKRINNIRRAR